MILITEGNLRLANKAIMGLFETDGYRQLLRRLYAGRVIAFILV